jgi:spermidine/putrescine transport system substrate-binding protein
VKKLIKNALISTTVFAVVIGFVGCGMSSDTSNKNDIKYTETLKVYNASEYIDRTTIAAFEKEFAVKVEYAEFESNEDMYDEISKNPNAYDVLVPSDYTIDRLIKEEKLAKLDKNKVFNIANVAEEYLKPSYDPNNDYVVPYMVGTLGILYNKKRVTDPIDSWTALFDSKYNGKVLMLDSQRDSLGATLKMLGFSMNSNDDAELAEAKAKLLAARSIASAYNDSEEIRDKMVADEGILGVVYSGDAKTAIDRNPNLAYVVPKEGANKWVDGFVIMKNTQHLEAAHNFINFMCRANIAIRNMTKIGYTSPIKGSWSEFNENKIMFPSADELIRCEAFLYNAEATQKYSKIWTEVRASR